jgi:hypothetical protein
MLYLDPMNKQHFSVDSSLLESAAYVQPERRAE